MRRAGAFCNTAGAEYRAKAISHSPDAPESVLPARTGRGLGSGLTYSAAELYGGRPEPQLRGVRAVEPMFDATYPLRAVM